MKWWITGCHGSIAAPGMGSILRLGCTQSPITQSVKREVKQDRWRNAWLQRLYDGSFFIAMKVFEAVGRNVDNVRPTFRSPIRPYNGGELNTDAVSHLLADISCALCIMFCGVCDALCAFCERSQLSQPSEAEMMDQPEPTPSVAPIGPPIAQSRREIWTVTGVCLPCVVWPCPARPACTSTSLKHEAFARMGTKNVHQPWTLALNWGRGARELFVHQNFRGRGARELFVHQN